MQRCHSGSANHTISCAASGRTHIHTHTHTCIRVSYIKCLYVCKHSGAQHVCVLIATLVRFPMCDSMALRRQRSCLCHSFEHRARSSFRFSHLCHSARLLSLSLQFCQRLSFILPHFVVVAVVVIVCVFAVCRHNIVFA